MISRSADARRGGAVSEAASAAPANAMAWATVAVADKRAAKRYRRELEHRVRLRQLAA